MLADLPHYAQQSANSRNCNRGTRNPALEPKALGAMAVGAREAVVLMSLVTSLLFSGIIFGWPSFSMLLQQDGAFLDERRDAECRRLALPLCQRN